MSTYQNAISFKTHPFILTTSITVEKNENTTSSIESNYYIRIIVVFEKNVEFIAKCHSIRMENRFNTFFPNYSSDSVHCVYEGHYGISLFLKNDTVIGKAELTQFLEQNKILVNMCVCAYRLPLSQ